MARKALRCKLGRHQWRLLRNDDNEPYYECARCQTVRTTNEWVMFDTGGMSGMG